MYFYIVDALPNPLGTGINPSLKTLISKCVFLYRHQNVYCIFRPKQRKSLQNTHSHSLKIHGIIVVNEKRRARSSSLLSKMFTCRDIKAKLCEGLCTQNGKSMDGKATLK